MVKSWVFLMRRDIDLTTTCVMAATTRKVDKRVTFTKFDSHRGELDVCPC